MKEDVIFNATTNSRMIGKVLTRNKDTFYALKELINNSIMADAKNINIQFTPSNCDMDSILYHPIEEIMIEDDGNGVPYTEFNKSIMELATDNKKSGYGVGRFSGLQIGRVMSIHTTAYDKAINKFTTTEVSFCESDLQNKNLNDIPFNGTKDISDTKIDSGYCVTLSSLYTNEADCNRINKLSKDFKEENFPQKIFEHYHSYIFKEKIKFVFNGKELKTEQFCKSEPKTLGREYKDIKGNYHNITLLIYSLRLKDTKVKIFFEGNIGGVNTTLLEFSYKSIWYTSEMGAQYIIVKSDIITTDFCDQFLLAGEHSKECKEFSSNIKTIIDNYYKSSNAKYNNFVKDLTTDKNYPFSQKEKEFNPVAASIFNQSSFVINEEIQLFKSTDSTRAVIFKLLKKIIQNGDIEFIINNVLGLSKENTQMLVELLDKSSLDEVVRLSSIMVDRESSLDLIHQITVSNTASNTELWKKMEEIISQDLWMFGNEFIESSNIRMDTNLKEMLTKLFQDMLIYKPTKKDNNLDLEAKPKVKKLEDILYSNEKIGWGNAKEEIIILMKSPATILGQKELGNLDSLLYKLETESKYPKKNHEYKIYIITTKMSDFAKNSIFNSSYNEEFLYKMINKNDISIKSYVLEWSELININRDKISVLSNHLNMNKSNAQNLFLEKYADYLQPNSRVRMNLVR